MRDIEKEFSLIRTDRRVIPSGRLWNPAADVYRCELEIEIHDSMLRISGCRRDTHYRDGFVYHQMEITYSRFEKSIQFPAPIEGASIRHDYTDGFLIINVRREQD
jgi:HSP20 family molecular chaperone IbpA